mmetsp:Transcript_6832/g.15623  ORF Transcript_6832/g.15623 Transcript_6832/m.15623 type:complete len:210 (+) Transcript_6832:1647-2276(+)
MFSSGIELHGVNLSFGLYPSLLNSSDPSRYPFPVDPSLLRGGGSGSLSMNAASSLLSSLVLSDGIPSMMSLSPLFLLPLRMIPNTTARPIQIPKSTHAIHIRLRLLASSSVFSSFLLFFSFFFLSFSSCSFLFFSSGPSFGTEISPTGGPAMSAAAMSAIRGLHSSFASSDCEEGSASKSPICMVFAESRFGTGFFCPSSPKRISFSND